MLKKVLDYGHTGVGGSPWMTPRECDRTLGVDQGNNSSYEWCPDGAYSNTHKMGRYAVASFTPPNNLTTHNYDFEWEDEDPVGSCNWDSSVDCSCDNWNDLRNGGSYHVGSDTTCTAATDCSGGGGDTVCNVAAIVDADLDGMADSWETTYCGVGSGDPEEDGDCLPNATDACWNAQWTSNGYAGDTTTYPCIELYSYDTLLGELIAPDLEPLVSDATSGINMSGVKKQ